MFTQASPAQPIASITACVPPEDAHDRSGVLNYVKCDDGFSTDFYELLVLMGAGATGGRIVTALG